MSTTDEPLAHEALAKSKEAPPCQHCSSVWLMRCCDHRLGRESSISVADTKTRSGADQALPNVAQVDCLSLTGVTKQIIRKYSRISPPSACGSATQRSQTLTPHRGLQYNKPRHRLKGESKAHQPSKAQGELASGSRGRHKNTGSPKHPDADVNAHVHMNKIPHATPFQFFIES